MRDCCGICRSYLLFAVPLMSFCGSFLTHCQFFWLLMLQSGTFCAQGGLFVGRLGSLLSCRIYPALLAILSLYPSGLYLYFSAILSRGKPKRKAPGFNPGAFLVRFWEGQHVIKARLRSFIVSAPAVFVKKKIKPAGFFPLT